VDRSPAFLGDGQHSRYDESNMAVLDCQANGVAATGTQGSPLSASNSWPGMFLKSLTRPLRVEACSLTVTVLDGNLLQ
jgi:hypothetical protein